jgi:hypothetical protein
MVEMDDFMDDKVRKLRPRIPDTEKITVNLGYVDLGHVDRMVRKGSIRTARISSGRPSAISSNAART